MKPVEIYTTPTCGYCAAAKRLLKTKGVAFTETDVSIDPALRAAMVDRAPGPFSNPASFGSEKTTSGCTATMSKS